MAVGIRVEGLADLRRDLRAVHPAIERALKDELEDAAKVVTRYGATLAPRKSGRLASSLQTQVRGNRVVAYSRLPYSSVQHWGGTIAPRGAPIRIQRTEFLSRAAEAKASQFESRIADSIERALARVLNLH